MEKEMKYNYKIICVKSPRWLRKVLKIFVKKDND